MVDKLASKEVIDILPKLTPEQEVEMIRVCWRGDVLGLDDRNITSAYEWFGPGSFLDSIELSGIPGSGKTVSTIHTHNQLINLGLNNTFIEEPEFPKGVPEDEKLVAIRYFLASASNLLNTYYGEYPKPIIMDGGIHKQLAFLKTDYDLGLIDKNEFKLAQQFIVTFVSEYVSSLIIIHTTPEQALTNKGVGLDSRKKILSMNYLSHLENNFRILPDQIASLKFDSDGRNMPLFIADIEATKLTEEELKDTSLRTIGSLCSIFQKLSNQQFT